ncbi:MAG: hypothetical protein LC130_16850, partial [Bryobacterales bacterium]|nr:hypothetical protein [Bryobacterales bacterium]
MTAVELTNDQVDGLARKSIVFGHMSVGDDIVKGLTEIMAADARLQVRIVKFSEAVAETRPAFVEGRIGKNRYPRSKDQAFADLLENGFGSRAEIALYKYCYADIDETTDIKTLAASYG